jgi:hypothetical protein
MDELPLGPEEGLRVVDFPRTNLADVALQLRQLADWIESAKDEQFTAIVILGRECQHVNVYGFGARTSGLEVQGWLARAAAHVAGNVERHSDEGPKAA